MRSPCFDAIAFGDRRARAGVRRLAAPPARRWLRPVPRRAGCRPAGALAPAAECSARRSGIAGRGDRVRRSRAYACPRSWPARACGARPSAVSTSVDGSASGMPTRRVGSIRARTGALARNMITGAMIVKCARPGCTGRKTSAGVPFGDHAANGGEDAARGAPASSGSRCAPPSATSRSMIGRKAVRVDACDERRRSAGRACWRAAAAARRSAAQPLADRRTVLAEHGAVQRVLAGEVVVDHRLVDAGAAGDAVDGGRGEAARAELEGGGGEDAAAGAGGLGGGACACACASRHRVFMIN